jgi:hypothetical protein
VAFDIFIKYITFSESQAALAFFVDGTLLLLLKKAFSSSIL